MFSFIKIIQKSMKIVKIEINNSVLREFLKNVLDCEYGISNTLNDELVNYKKNISDLNDVEIEELAKNVFTMPPIFILYNLEDDDGNLLLPMIYNDFFDESENKELFCVGKFGIQCIDLFNKNGMLIYKDAYWISFHTENYIEIWDQNCKINIFRYRKSEDDLEILAEPDGNTLERLISFNESRFFLNGGFVDENFNVTTPNCFDDANFFTEGLAPVCINGKWGYINKKAEVVIDFIYGGADQFKDGIAKVFVLKPEFQNEKGVWIDVDLYKGYTQSQFLKLFPEFNKKVRKPLCFLREITKTSKELNEEYHYFAEGVEDKFGCWVEINSIGEINNKHKPSERVEVNSNENNIDSDFWFNYVTENSDCHKIVSEIPDLLFIDKTFVIRILEKLPNLFYHFSVLYSDDNDVAELVFSLSKRNFDFLSERLRLIYQVRYNQLMIAEHQQLFEDNDLNNQNLDDNLPF
jgi:hypothetical protein